jgi:hypothetical protein
MNDEKELSMTTATLNGAHVVGEQGWCTRCFISADVLAETGAPCLRVEGENGESAVEVEKPDVPPEYATAARIRDGVVTGNDLSAVWGMALDYGYSGHTYDHVDFSDGSMYCSNCGDWVWGHSGEGIEKGHWKVNTHALVSCPGEEPETTIYTVRCRRICKVWSYADVEVEAENQDDAWEKAQDMLNEGYVHDWEEEDYDVLTEEVDEIL